MKKYVFGFFLCIIIVQNIYSQEKTITTQSLFWTRYYNQLSINKKLTWHNEIDNRRFFENNKQHHLIIHSRFHYRFYQNTDFALGFTYSRQSPHDLNATINLVIPEFRPNQEINFTNPISKKLTLQQRLRIDERFTRKSNKTELLEGFDFNFRFRYRLQASYIISKIEAKKPTILKVTDELMVNAGKNIIYNHFDQNRIYIGLEQNINKNFSAELGYLHWYQQRNIGYQFFSRNIIRLTLYHKIKL